LASGQFRGFSTQSVDSRRSISWDECCASGRADAFAASFRNGHSWRIPSVAGMAGTGRLRGPAADRSEFPIDQNRHCRFFLRFLSFSERVAPLGSEPRQVTRRRSRPSLWRRGPRPVSTFPDDRATPGGERPNQQIDIDLLACFFGSSELFNRRLRAVRAGRGASGARYPCFQPSREL
jgi:hypothetical protein